MSAGVLVKEREWLEDWNILVEDELDPVADAEIEVEDASLADRWVASDPLDEVLMILVRTGREREAQIIARILGDRDDDKLHRAMLISMQPSLAEDWDSPEDAIYDEL